MPFDWYLLSASATLYIVSRPRARVRTLRGVESSPMRTSPTWTFWTSFILPSYMRIGVLIPRHLPAPQYISKIPDAGAGATAPRTPPANVDWGQDTMGVWGACGGCNPRM